MDISTQIKFLEKEHASLNKKIDGMEKTGVFKDEQLSEMKRKRLQIKEQLVILRKRQFEENYERLNWDE